MDLLGAMFSFLPLFFLTWVPLAIVVFLINYWGSETVSKTSIEATKRSIHQ